MFQEKFEVMPAVVNPRQQSLPTHGESSSRSTTEEDRAWSQLYAAIHQPSAAEEVTRQLDADLQSKRNHLALYIRAKTTLRERKAEEARNQRIASFVRQVLTALVVVPVRALRNVLATSMSIALAMLPPVRREPAQVRSKALKSDPNYARAKVKFASSAEGTAGVADTAGPAGPAGAADKAGAATQVAEVEESVKAA